MTDQKRLTIIEILVVLVVIGLVSLLAALAVSSARANARDAVRLSNVRQVQSALEDFFVARNEYPTGQNIPLGFGAVSCLTTQGFQTGCDATTEGVLIKAVPATLSSGLDNLSSCGGSANAFCYFVSNDGSDYQIMFELEHDIPLAKLLKGLNCATSTGMKAGACSFVGE